MDKLDIIEHIQEKPYWLIDVLPYQVPADSAGQYFKVEEYLLAHMDSLGRKFLDVLLKLNCYKTWRWVQTGTIGYQILLLSSWNDPSGRAYLLTPLFSS